MFCSLWIYTIKMEAILFRLAYKRIGVTMFARFRAATDILWAPFRRFTGRNFGERAGLLGRSLHLRVQCRLFLEISTKNMMESNFEHWQNLMKFQGFESNILKTVRRARYRGEWLRSVFRHMRSDVSWVRFRGAAAYFRAQKIEKSTNNMFWDTNLV